MKRENLSPVETEASPSHTPGPWTVRDDGRTVRGGAWMDGRKDDGMLYVADCGVSSSYRPWEETAANARLIAAAPELLAAIDFALTSTEDDDVILNRLTEAARLARGAP